MNLLQKSLATRISSFLLSFHIRQRFIHTAEGALDEMPYLTAGGAHHCHHWFTRGIPVLTGVIVLIDLQGAFQCCLGWHNCGKKETIWNLDGSFSEKSSLSLPFHTTLIKHARLSIATVVQEMWASSISCMHRRRRTCVAVFYTLLCASLCQTVCWKRLLGTPLELSKWPTLVSSNAH